MKSFDAQTLNLLHLGPVKVSYEPQGINTEAVLVTEENIGQLSLEFDAELYYDGAGRPFLYFFADRWEGDQPKKTLELMLRPTDWIVPLEREIHVYRSHTFFNTFSFDNGDRIRSIHPMDPSTPAGF